MEITTKNGQTLKGADAKAHIAQLKSDKKLLKSKPTRSQKQKSRSYANRLKRKATEPEKRLMELFCVYGINYSFQVPIHCGKQFYIADFLLNGHKKIVLELDGHFHTTDAGKEHDKKRDRLLRLNGFQVIRFFNYKIDNPELIIDILLKAGVIPSETMVFRGSAPVRLFND